MGWVFGECEKSLDLCFIFLWIYSKLVVELCNFCFFFGFRSEKELSHIDKLGKKRENII